ncbi:MAG: ribosome maturation factor RimM [Hyphomicrobiaceae bacterium]|nr:ribosome maturation factor RimM [Hyphomicrobiaceae bacterium]
MGAEPARVLLGQISAAHGVRGHVLIRTYTDAPEDIAAHGPLWDEAGERQLEVAVVRVTSKGVVARIAGVNDRNAAEGLRGTRLFIERERLPPTGEEEFYHSDLVGLGAIAPDGTPLGEVIAVHNFGAGDILEIRLAGARSTAMVSFTRAFVPDVDLAGGRLTVAMPVESGEGESSRS